MQECAAQSSLYGVWGMYKRLFFDTRSLSTRWYHSTGQQIARSIRIHAYHMQIATRVCGAGLFLPEVAPVSHMFVLHLHQSPLFTATSIGSQSCASKSYAVLHLSHHKNQGQLPAQRLTLIFQQSTLLPTIHSHTVLGHRQLTHHAAQWRPRRHISEATLPASAHPTTFEKGGCRSPSGDRPIAYTAASRFTPHPV